MPRGSAPAARTPVAGSRVTAHIRPRLQARRGAHRGLWPTMPTARRRRADPQLRELPALVNRPGFGAVGSTGLPVPGTDISPPRLDRTIRSARCMDLQRQTRHDDSWPRPYRPNRPVDGERMLRKPAARVVGAWQGRLRSRTPNPRGGKDHGQVAQCQEQHDHPHYGERKHARRPRRTCRRWVEVVTKHIGEGGAREASSAPPSLLGAYVAVVCCLGLAGLVGVVAATSWESIAHAAVWPIAFLAVATLVGEVKPLLISRSGESSGTVSTSGAFILALVAVGSVGVAVLVQAVASMADDLINRRTPKKSAFNTAQYVLSLLAARAVFSGLAGVPFFGGPMTFEVRHLVPLLAGGIAMVVVNLLLVAAVVSIATSQPLRTIVREDARFHAATQVVLLCIAATAPM